MKTFKEFKKESYSRVDEGFIRSAIGKGLGYMTGTELYDVAKPKNRKGREAVKQGIGIGAAFPKTAMKAAKFIAWNVPKAVLRTAAAMSKMR